MTKPWGCSKLCFATSSTDGTILLHSHRNCVNGRMAVCESHKATNWRTPTWPLSTAWQRSVRTVRFSDHLRGENRNDAWISWIEHLYCKLRQKEDMSYLRQMAVTTTSLALPTNAPVVSATKCPRSSTGLKAIMLANHCQLSLYTLHLYFWSWVNQLAKRIGLLWHEANTQSWSLRVLLFLWDWADGGSKRFVFDPNKCKTAMQTVSHMKICITPPNFTNLLIHKHT